MTVLALSSLSKVFVLLAFACEVSYGYKPVALVHGLFGEADDLLDLKKMILKVGIRYTIFFIVKRSFF